MMFHFIGFMWVSPGGKIMFVSIKKDEHSRRKGESRHACISSLIK
jgi:hypothetical protein